MGDSAWTKSKVRNEYYLHNYLPDMPELNLTNPKVREELKVTHSMARPNLKKKCGVGDKSYRSIKVLTEMAQNLHQLKSHLLEPNLLKCTSILVSIVK